MELLALKIPLDFVERTLGHLTWSEIRFGLENRLLDPVAPSEVAAAELNQPDPNPELLELATAKPGEPVLPLVNALADRETLTLDSRVSEKWVFLVLAWLFEHRNGLPDPLQAVENVYAEFDYPEGVAGFVRYMPSDEPDLGSQERNERRLMQKWERFLDEQRNEFGVR